ncbi:MAG: YbbR-like domain-containing protein [Tannerella sp.]|jgi:hypothetical protein|nr:YbbR-like domain-containing protein [Tannerella sp.]
MGEFPRKQKWKEVLIFLSFLLLSFGFWFLQTLQQDYERRIELPLKLRNVPKEWMIPEESPQTVRFVLKDKGTTLMYYVWKSGFSPLDISLANVSPATDSTVIINVRMLRNAMEKQLISTTSIVSIEPSDITVQYDRLSSKTVRVTPDLKVNTKQGFQISDSIKIDHPTVTLYAGSKILETLEEVRTKPVTLENASKTKEVTTKLDLPEGVRTDTETVHITIPIEEFTEKTFQLPVLCIDVPDGDMLRIFPATVQIVCNIPISHFKDLTEESLEIHMHFQAFQDHLLTGKLALQLTKKPDWLTSYKIAPSEVEFIIKQASP